MYRVETGLSQGPFGTGIDQMEMTPYLVRDNSTVQCLRTGLPGSGAI